MTFKSILGLLRHQALSYTDFNILSWQPASVCQSEGKVEGIEVMMYPPGGGATSLPASQASIKQAVMHLKLTGSLDTLFSTSTFSLTI